jgi:hypothetical protein
MPVKEPVVVIWYRSNASSALVCDADARRTPVVVVDLERAARDAWVRSTGWIRTSAPP